MSRVLLQQVIELSVGPTRPDLTFLLSVSLEVTRQRLGKRNAHQTSVQDHFEAESLSFFERVDEAYHGLSKEEPDRFEVVDGSSPIQQVSAKIWSVVQSRFGF